MNATQFRTTPQVAHLLGVPHWRIEHMIRDGDLVAPAQVGGTRMWSTEDVERARAALAARAARVAARRRTTRVLGASRVGPILTGR